MVPVIWVTSWIVVTSLLLLSVSAAARVLFLAVSVATDAPSLVVMVANFAMVSTVYC